MQTPLHAIREAYERWAPTYAPVPHNPLMAVEQQAMLAQWPESVGKRVLDLACGSGRYATLLTESGAAQVTALDFSAAMLRRVANCHRVQASMMSLPFMSGYFNTVVSGLAIGHASSVERWMHEVARVLARDGVLLYSDFHPEAARAGLTRSFKDEQGVTCTVPHNAFGVAIQTAAAAQAGLFVERVLELRAGLEVHEPFPDSEAFYRQWHGLPLVLIVRARKP
jgi:ubiquinone/menaquinone biosynthesis C-methylase UbiE